MKLMIDALQVVKLYDYINNVDTITFEQYSDMQQFRDTRNYLSAIIKQFNYIKSITGHYPVSVEIDPARIAWIMDNIGDKSKCKILYTEL